MTMGNEGMVRISTHTRTLAIGGGGLFFVDYSSSFSLLLFFSFDRMRGVGKGPGKDIELHIVLSFFSLG